MGLKHHGLRVPLLWPWGQEDWRPEGGRLGNLIKAGAFISAEIDRIQAEMAREAAK